MSLEHAWTALRSGNLTKAEQTCREVLVRAPRDVAALLLLSLVARESGQEDVAADALKKVIGIKPDHAEAHNNLGNVLARRGELGEADGCFREALRLNPDYPEAHNNLGNTLRDRGRLDEAIESYQKAIRISPKYVDAHNNLGIAYARGKRTDEACGCYLQALKLRPEYPEAHNNMGIAMALERKFDQAIEHFEAALRIKPSYADAHCNLAIAYRDQGKLDAAIISCRQAIQLQPSHVRAHNNLGRMLLEQGNFDEAIYAFREAIRYAPDDPEGHRGLGKALFQQGLMDEAIKSWAEVLRIRPKDSETHVNLARALSRERHFSDALLHLGRALQLRPNNATAHLQRALINLLTGEFQRGWEEYEWRWKCKEFNPRDFKQPAWDGSALQGRRILLHAEQGYGDTLQFLRFAKLVKDRGGTVILWCPKSITRIASSCPYVDEVTVEGETLPEFDVHLPLLSLPRIFKTTLRTVPAGEPYLQADATRVEHWRRELQHVDAIKVGICWQGNTANRNDATRSVPLAHFAPLAKVPNIRLVSLQKGPGCEQLRDAAFSVIDFGTQLDNEGAFLDTAAILMSLDLVVTADTAIAHLAGALNVPTWVALPYAADWRWLLTRADSPWYPQTRLFRQVERGNWEDVFERLAAQLAEFVHQGGEGARAPSQVVATAEDLNAMGVELAESARLDEAAVAFRQAVELNPRLAHVHNNLGNALRNLGRADEAAKSLQEAIRLRPDYPEAHNNLGIVLARQRKLDEAQIHFRTAVELRPEYASAHNNLGIALHDQRKWEEAAQCFNTALSLEPSFASAFNNLGNTQAESNQFEDAIRSFQRAIELDPAYADAHNNLGNALREVGKFDEALACFDKALQLRPQNADAYNNYGIALSRQRKYEESVQKYQQALRLRPDFTAVHNNLGIAYANLRMPEKAIASYRQALRLKPDYAEAHNNLAIVLTQQGQFDEAFKCYRRSLELKPDYPEAYSNLGIALAEAGDTEQALVEYARAIELRHDYPDAHMNRALTLLIRGEFEPGWDEYEWRWKCKDFNPRNFKPPRWDGSPLDGRRILLHTEQGFGDTFQFVRYARHVKQRGGVVIIRCPKPLTRIVLRCPWIDEVCIEGDNLPHFDVHLPLLSLPKLVGTTLATVPADEPYIIPEQELIEQWHKELGYIDAFRVGINWQGNPKYRGDHRRSIPLVHFGALAEIPGVRLVSLQKGFGSEQLDDVRFSLSELGNQVDTVAGAFMDTAAVLKCLDLVVTSDTSLAHLAGAVGAPVWLALPVAPDWRWLLGREDSPWYPSMRLFRQTKLDNWEDVFGRMAASLTAAVKAKAAGRPLHAMTTLGELVDRIIVLRLEFEDSNGDESMPTRVRELNSLVELRVRIPPLAQLARLEAELEAAHRILRHTNDELRGALGDETKRLRMLVDRLFEYRDRRERLRDQITELHENSLTGHVHV